MAQFAELTRDKRAEQFVVIRLHVWRNDAAPTWRRNAIIFLYLVNCLIKTLLRVKVHDLSVTQMFKFLTYMRDAYAADSL